MAEKLNYLQASSEWASAATKSGVWSSETGDQEKITLVFLCLFLKNKTNS